MRLMGALTALVLICGPTTAGSVQSPPPDPPVLIVSPHPATLNPGASEQFSAVGTGADEVLWRATGGTISPTGVYVAGPTPGSFTVTASTSRVTATVDVVIDAGLPATAAVPVLIHPGES